MSFQNSWSRHVVPGQIQSPTSVLWSPLTQVNAQSCPALKELEVGGGSIQSVSILEHLGGSSP